MEESKKKRTNYKYLPRVIRSKYKILRIFKQFW